MKKNISINIFGTLYAIDEDAYDLLENYLNSMKNYFAKQAGGEEIADDIEHRVAEILWQKKEAGADTVTIDTIKDIMNQIGDPAQISGDNEASTADNATNDGEPLDSHPFADGGSTSRSNGFTSDNDNYQKENVSDNAFDRIKRRRLYRVLENKTLGGVCTGLSQYLDIDITLLRLAVVVMAIVFWFVDLPFIGTIINWCVPLGYCLLWAIVPVAHTTEDRLRMNGRDINPQNINEQILNDSNAQSQQMYQSYSSSNGNNNDGCLKAGCCGCLFVMLFPLIMSLLGLIFAVPMMGGLANGGLFSGIFGHLSPFDEPEGTMFMSLIENMQGTLWIITICLIVLIIIPIFFLIHWIRNTNKPISTASIIALILLWFVALITSVFFIFRGVGKMGKDAIDLGFALDDTEIVFNDDDEVEDICYNYYADDEETEGYDSEEEYEWLVDNGWQIKNRTNCSRFTYSGEYMTGDEDVKYLDCENEWNKMRYTAEKSEMHEPGYYRLTASTRSYNGNAFLFARTGGNTTGVGHNFMALTGIKANGNEGGDVWEWATGKKSAQEANIPAELLDKKQLIADANCGIGYGWNITVIDSIPLPEAGNIYYGVTTDKKITKDKNTPEWFSACDFKLERIGDIK